MIYKVIYLNVDLLKIISTILNYCTFLEIVFHTLFLLKALLVWNILLSTMGE